MKVVQAYRFALDLTAVQERAVLSHCGAARVAYNWGLARVRAVAVQRAAERSYEVAEPDLTPAVGWSLLALPRAWNAAKAEVAPWWADNSKEAYNTGLDALARALKNWSDSRAGRRKGRPVGFPRFKSRRRSTPAVRFTTGAIRVESDRKHVTLPRLGRLKTHESTRKLARRIEAGSARVMSATVRRRESSNGRRADRKTRPGGPVAMKRQPGTAMAGKTGTVPPQGGTSQRALTEAH